MIRGTRKFKVRSLIQCTGYWAIYLRWLSELALFRFATDTALKSPNKDETAVCGCNPVVSVLVVVLSRKVYFSRSMISQILSILENVNDDG